MEPSLKKDISSYIDKIPFKIDWNSLQSISHTEIISFFLIEKKTEWVTGTGETTEEE